VTIRVLVADDQALVRASFGLLVDTARDIEAVGEAANGAQAVDLARRARPDVILMDILMPGMDGIEATRAITADPATASVRVLILTTFDTDANVFAALRAGAAGFLLKDTPPADLLAAIRVVALGEALLAPTVTRRLIAEFTRRRDPGPPDTTVLRSVTDREREVLTLVGLGRSNSEIAAGLHPASPPSRPTSGACWRSWMPGTAPSWSSPPTTPDSCSRPDGGLFAVRGSRRSARC
jgi:DNA-binding NarL/FixJ family response regulator